MKLTIDLIPASAWGKSLYNLYRNSGHGYLWQQIKEDLIKKEGNQCWVCEAKDSRLEAHEFWEYDIDLELQTLTAIHHLCILCHMVKHPGFLTTEAGIAQLRRMGIEQADIIRHFCNVNGCKESAYYLYVGEAFAVWRERSDHNWKQDYGDYGPDRGEM